jgi:hypothetical protein
LSVRRSSTLAPKRESAVELQTRDGGEVAVLEAEAVVVEALDRHVADGGGGEAVGAGGGSRHLFHPCRLVLEPGLVRRHLAGLRRAHPAAEVLLALPTLPGELVVVPHADERPAGAGVLQVGVGQVAAVEGAVVFEVGRYVEVFDLLTVRIR